MTLDRVTAGLPLLFDRSDHDQPSFFLARNLLREARRQRRLTAGDVPEVCLLDPDGDVVRHLEASRRGERSATWACYHTALWETVLDGVPVGIVPHAVGAPFAVLVAEELFASGCRLLVSVTSAGTIDPTLPLPEVVLIERAFRGEGTSHAYLPPAPSIDADPALIDVVVAALSDGGIDAARGTSWTTDAPFRETATALSTAREAGAVVVEMEAAALYAFGAACRQPVVCFAHVTNAMAVDHGDFEKGPANGAEQALALVVAAAEGWTRTLA
jgi:uridine phosphorylase